MAGNWPQELQNPIVHPCVLAAATMCFRRLFGEIGLPFILKDRDSVSEVHIEADPAAREFALIYRPATGAAAPPTRHVRGEILAGRFQAVSLERGRRTRLTAELQCDPKGAIPGWIANFFQRAWPQNTFQALRAQAAKADIAMPPEFRNVLEPTRDF